MGSKQGQLLVASPHLPDPNFFRTVIFMVQHDEEGAVGLVLNRPSSSRLRDVWKQISEMPCESDDYIRVGGPVSGPLMALHSHAELAADFEIKPGIFFSTDIEALEVLVAEGDRPYRIFSGYSGWGQGQLDQELKVGGWLSTEATWEHVFQFDDDTLWKSVANSIGDQITRTVLKIRHKPFDPSAN